MDSACLGCLAPFALNGSKSRQHDFIQFMIELLFVSPQPFVLQFFLSTSEGHQRVFTHLGHLNFAPRAQELGRNCDLHPRGEVTWGNPTTQQESWAWSSGLLSRVHCPFCPPSPRPSPGGRLKTAMTPCAGTWQSRCFEDYVKSASLPA